MKPEAWTPPSLEIRSLRALARRAENLIDMLSQEKNRLGTAHDSVIPWIKEHIIYLLSHRDPVEQFSILQVNQDCTGNARNVSGIRGTPHR